MKENETIFNINSFENSNTQDITQIKHLFHINSHTTKCRVIEIDEWCKQVQKCFSSGTIYQPLKIILFSHFWNSFEIYMRA